MLLLKMYFIAILQLKKLAQEGNLLKATYIGNGKPRIQNDKPREPHFLKYGNKTGDKKRGKIK